jgi:GDP-D-mannose dehydratase
MKTFTFGKGEVYMKTDSGIIQFKHKQDPMIDNELSPRDHKKKFEVEFVFEDMKGLENLINNLKWIRDDKIYKAGADAQLEYFKNKLGLEVK